MRLFRVFSCFLVFSPVLRVTFRPAHSSLLRKGTKRCLFVTESTFWSLLVRTYEWAGLIWIPESMLFARKACFST